MDNKLKIKDFITTGIFFVLLMAARVVFELVGATMPMLYVLAPVFSAILMGPIYMLYISKVPKVGAVFLMTLITGIFYMVMGGTYLALIFFVIVGVIAELIRMPKDNCKRVIPNIAAYVVFAIGGIGAFLPFYVMKDQYYNFLEHDAGMGHEFVAGLKNIMEIWILPMQIGLTVITGIIGGILGYKMLSKHFKKAGITMEAVNG